MPFPNKSTRGGVRAGVASVTEARVGAGAGMERERGSRQVMSISQVPHGGNHSQQSNRVHVMTPINQMSRTNIRHPTESDTIPTSRTAAEHSGNKRKYQQNDTLMNISQSTAETRLPQPTFQSIPHSIVGHGGHGHSQAHAHSHSQSQGHGHGHSRTLESLDISDFTAAPSSSQSILSRSSLGQSHSMGRSLSQHGGSLNLADRRKTLSQISRRFALPPPSAPRARGPALIQQQQHNSQVSSSSMPSSSRLTLVATHQQGDVASTSNNKLATPALPSRSGTNTSSSLICSASSALNNSPRSRTTSELAKTIVLPSMDTVIHHQSKKKIKFTPPIVRGGYTDRFIQFYGSERLEYATWANAYLRQVKIFGSSLPVATVQVVELFRDHNILLSKCRVIPSEVPAVSDKQPIRPLQLPQPDAAVTEIIDIVPESPPLDPVPEKQLVPASPTSLEHIAKAEDVSMSEQPVLPEPQQPYSEAKSTGGDVPLTLECVATNDVDFTQDLIKLPLNAQHLPDDSIAGLHTDLERLAFLASSQGSELGTQPLARRRVLEELEYFNPSMLASQLADSIPIAAPNVLVMPSSQGSEDDGGLNDVDHDLHDSHRRQGQHQENCTSSPDASIMSNPSTRSSSPELVSSPARQSVTISDDEMSVDATTSTNILPRTPDVTVDDDSRHAHTSKQKIIETIDPNEEERSNAFLAGSSATAADNGTSFPRSETIDITSSATGSTPPHRSKVGSDGNVAPVSCLKDDSAMKQDQTQKDEGVSYIHILFSSTFHWSTLSVMDRIEIHPPFREIELKGQDQGHATSSAASRQSVWVAERYRVIPSGIPL